MEVITQPTKDWLSGLLAISFEVEKHDYSHQDEVYKIKTSDSNFYLKISPTLQSERDNLIKMQPYLRVPNVIGFTKIADKDHLLLSEVPGKNLSELVSVWENTAIVREFAAATKYFHSLDVNMLFSGDYDSAAVVLHGDMSLPNILCTEPGVVSYIDLGQMSVGSPDVDLADAIWSLQRNISPDYGELFLKEYGNFVMTEKIDKALRFRYTS